MVELQERADRYWFRVRDSWTRGWKGGRTLRARLPDSKRFEWKLKFMARALSLAIYYTGKTADGEGT
jgi:hypothetical protein